MKIQFWAKELLVCLVLVPHKKMFHALCYNPHRAQPDGFFLALALALAFLFIN